MTLHGIKALRNLPQTIAEDRMINPVPIQTQELFKALQALGMPAQSLYQILKTSLFKNCTFDLFMGSDQYRVEGARFTPVVGHIEIALPSKIKRRVNNEWNDLNCIISGIEQYFHMPALVLAPHSPEGDLFFASVAPLDQRKETMPVRFVLFREGYDLSDSALQVVGWRDAINPLVGVRSQ